MRRLLILLSLAIVAPAWAQTPTELERQSWRAQQHLQNPAEQRAGERRLDAIDRKAQTDPRAARDMQRIWEADRSLGTLNRPGPGGTMPQTPGNPSLVGPGDRN